MRRRELKQLAEHLGTFTMHKRLNSVLFEIGALRRDLEAARVLPRRGPDMALLKRVASTLYGNIARQPYAPAPTRKKR